MRGLPLHAPPTAASAATTRAAVSTMRHHSSAQSSAAAAALAALLLVNQPLQLPFLPSAVPPAFARELASGSGSKVNKDPESLLRYGLPAQPKAIRDAQTKLEEADDQFGRSLPVTGKAALDNAKGTLKGKGKDILAAVPAAKAEAGKQLLDEILGDVDEAEAGAVVKIKGALGKMTQLEELIASGYKIPTPPKEFVAELPYLKGRASIEWELKRNGAKFDVEGTLYDKLQLTTIVDGFTAPLTSGNFVDLVNKGFYNGYTIQRSDGFVVQTGDAKQAGKSEKTGYVPEGKTNVRNVPLEVYVKGDKEPIYSTTFDDDGRGGYAAALPFNAYGALGMAREEYDVDSASSQFFWLLFDSDLTPAGKNLLDGRYACFGYTVDGARLLSDVKEGDVIVSAKVTRGLENLVMPPNSGPAPAPAASS